MPALPSYFEKFLQNIRPDVEQRKQMQNAHRYLRERLAADHDMQKILIADFLEGSYRRHTDVKDVNGKRSDVDVVGVTNLSEIQYPNPADAQAEFVPFLNRHFRGRWKAQGRSFAIEMDGVKLDFVPTSVPSEALRRVIKSAEVQTLYEWNAEELDRTYKVLKRAAEGADWQREPLRIPNRDANRWEDTHPLEQIRWTIAKNNACNGHFLSVARSLKWWWRVRHPDCEYPKGYPFEHVVGDCCSNGVDSVALGVVCTLEAIRDNYAGHRRSGTKPRFADRGVPKNDVWERISVQDFAAFYDRAAQAASAARYAYNLSQEQIPVAVAAWRAVFGAEFPDGGSDEGSKSGQTGGFTPRVGVTVPARPRRYA